MEVLQIDESKTIHWVNSLCIMVFYLTLSASIISGFAVAIGTQINDFYKSYRNTSCVEVNFENTDIIDTYRYLSYMGLITSIIQITFMCLVKCECHIYNQWCYFVPIILSFIFIISCIVIILIINISLRSCLDDIQADHTNCNDDQISKAKNIVTLISIMFIISVSFTLIIFIVAACCFMDSHSVDSLCYDIGQFCAPYCRFVPTV